MKSFVVCVLVISIVGVSMAHDSDFYNKKVTAERVQGYEGSTYVVEYDYYPGRGGTVPLTNPLGNMHYGATVRVYRIVGDQREKIGQDMNGQYVEGGCFEDEPGIYIKRAIYDAALTAQ